MRRTLLLTLLVLLAFPVTAAAVVGGGPASRPYPHMTALSAGGEFRCGASLVAPEWVLTAAHCMFDDEDERLAPSRVSLAIGRIDRTDAAQGEARGVAQVIVHESYGSPEPNSNDVALLRLSRPSGQAPIRIATPSERAIWSPGTRATVIGWGAQDPVFSGAARDLREVEVPIVSDEACARSYEDSLGFDPRTMMCAGELLGLRDACQGDSGGPLMVPDRRGVLTQVGVVSFGLSCGLPTQYGVYARVADSALYGWIAARAGLPATAPTGGSSTQPGGDPQPGAPAAQTGAHPAKLSLARARIGERRRELDVLAPITRRASGDVAVELHAAGRRTRFAAPVDADRGHVRFRRPIPRDQARLGTGILTLRYPGDADTLPATLRLRAASRPARLDAERPTLDGDRLRATGTLSRRAHGVVRVRLSYLHEGRAYVLQRTARIRDGRYALDARIPADDAARIAARSGTVHSSTQFTGDLEERMRGEAQAFQVLPARS